MNGRVARDCSARRSSATATPSRGTASTAACSGASSSPSGATCCGKARTASASRRRWRSGPSWGSCTTTSGWKGHRRHDHSGDPHGAARREQSHNILARWQCSHNRMSGWIIPASVFFYSSSSSRRVGVTRVKKVWRGLLDVSKNSTQTSPSIHAPNMVKYHYVKNGL